MIGLSSLPWKRMKPEFAARDGEELMSTFSTHWIKYVPPVSLYSMLVAGSLLLISGSVTVRTTAPLLFAGGFLSGLMILSLAHHWFFHRVLSEGMMDIIITNKRFIFLEDRLWFEDDMRELAMERIRAVEAHKHGIIQNLFRYGDLWFDTGGSDAGEDHVIPLVPHPHYKAKIITDMLEGI